MHGCPVRYWGSRYGTDGLLTSLRHSLMNMSGEDSTGDGGQDDRRRHHHHHHQKERCFHGDVVTQRFGVCGTDTGGYF